MNQRGWVFDNVIDTILWVVFFLVAAGGVYLLLQKLF